MKLKKLLAAAIATVTMAAAVPLQPVQRLIEDIAITASAESTITPVTPQLDSDGFYSIGSAAELYGFAELVNSGNASANAKLIADIIVNENVLDANGEANTGDFVQWTPIGNDYFEDKVYSGTFDGQGHTVSGLYVSGNGWNVGFVGRVSGTAVVKNLGIVDSYFSSSNNFLGSIVGGVANNSSVTLANVYSTSTVKGENYIGGLVGSDGTSSVTIINSYFAGKTSANWAYGSHHDDLVSGDFDRSTLTVCNAFVLGTSQYGTSVTAEQMSDGTVAAALHYYQDALADGSMFGLSGGKTNFSGTIDGVSVPTANITLHTFTGDTKTYSSKYIVGNTTPLPVNVEREGYTFFGWYDNADLEGDAVTSISSSETDDKEYWAKFERSHAVSFVLGGGTIRSGEIDHYIEGETTALPTMVFKNGASFEGWYTTEDFTGSRYYSIPSTATEDMTFYAKWGAEKTTFYLLQNSSEPVNILYEGENIVWLDKTTHSELDYYFDGYYVQYNSSNIWGSDGTGIIVPYTGGESTFGNNRRGFCVAQSGFYVFTLTDKGDGNWFISVLYPLANNCTVSDIPDQTYTGSAIEPQLDIETNLTLGTDYTIEYSDNTNTGTATVTITGIGNYSGTIEKTFNITRNITISDSIEHGTVASNKVGANEGDTVTLTLTPDEGYRVKSVKYNDGTDHTITAKNGAYSFTMPDKNVTVSAEFEPISYTIEYELDGGSLAESVTNPTTYNIESDAIILNNPTKTGYTFAGWTGSNGTTAQTEVTIAKGSTTGDKSYTANWTPNTYTVKFDKNADDAASEMADQTPFTYDVEQALKENEFTRDGYTFVGWAETADGKVVYADKKAVKNLSAENNGEVTLYAKWAKKATVDDNVKKADTANAAKLGGKEITFVGGEITGTTYTYTDGNGDPVNVNATDVKMKVEPVDQADVANIKSKLDELVSKASEQIPASENKKYAVTPLKSMDISLVTNVNSQDITLNDDNAEMWVTVKFNGVKLITDFVNKGYELVVMHIPDDANKPAELIRNTETETKIIVVDEETLMFKTPGFSDFTIAALEKQAKRTGGGSYIDYTYKTIDGVGYRIHPSYVGVYEGDKDIEDMVIKSEIEGKPVTTIEAGAFNSFKKMKSISLPDTLTTIEQGAFWGCAALEEIDIPETVTKIESNAFAYCSNLKKLTVRNKDCSIAMYNNTLYNDYKSSKYVYDGVIVGYVGSPAEKFANKFKYTFEDIEKVVVTTTTTEVTTTTTTTTTVSTGVSTTATSGTTTPVTTLKIGVVNDPKINNSGKITWSKAENAVQYCVAKIVGGKKFYGATVEENSYTLNSVPNEDYKLYVIAMGEDGRYTTGKVLDVKVAKPVGKAVAPTVDKDGNVTWKAVKNAVKYKAVKIVNGVYYGGAEVKTTSYKLDSVPANDYQVYILSYGENGAYTIGEKTTVKVDDPIGFVNDVKVDNSGKVSWSKAQNAAEYRVVKMIGDKKYYGSITPRTYYHFDSIPNEDYKLYVIAMGADGRYATGKVLAVKVNAVGKAAAPTVAKDGTVTWKAVDNAVKYKVVKKINGSYYGGSEVTETSYKLNNLPVSDYQIYVLSYGENGAVTVGEKTTVKVDKPLGFVNDVKVDKNGKVTWSKAQNAASYCVVKVFNGKKFYGGETKTTSYQFEKACYKDYQVYVIAYGANKDYTVGKRVTVEVGNLGVVLDPKVDKNGKVSWSAVRGAVKYKVWKVVGDKKSYAFTTDTTYTFKSVPTTDYSVYVIAFDKDGKYRIGTTKAVSVK